MAKRRKQKPAPAVHLTEGPLPLRLASQYAGHLWVFSDASQQTHGGLAAVIFSEPDAPPAIVTRRVPVMGSNELELQAALFALLFAEQRFPGRHLALFTDNQDSVTRLTRAKAQGLAQDPKLADVVPELDIADALPRADFCWVKGHASCRGNALADEHAGKAAR